MSKAAISVYIRPGHRRKIRRLAGMLRGLLNSFEGYRSVSGLTNENFELKPYVRVYFSSAKKAATFKKIVGVVLGKYVWTI